MFSRFNPIHVLQIGLLILLIVSIAQVTFWITDQIDYAQSVRDEFLSVLITTDPNEESARYNEEYIEVLYETTERRINRVIWEGAFFLFVLVIGIGILTKTIRREYELRKRQQNFLAAVSHELKTPLTSMRLTAETILFDKVSGEHKDGAIRVLSDVDRLLRMVDNLLDTNKIESGKIMIVREEIYISSIVESCLADFSDDSLKKMNFSLDLDKNLTLNSDRILLESIIRNVIDNSIKACKAANTFNIEIKTEYRDDEVKLTFKDNGIGFPEEDKLMIFEKFYRSGDELVRTMPGSGLGLYIVNKLVNLTEGKIEAISEGMNKWAKFIISWQK